MAFVFQSILNKTSQTKSMNLLHVLYYVQYYPCRELLSSHVHVSMGQFSTTVMSCTLIHSICMERGWSSHCCSDSGMCMSVAFVDSFCYHNRVVLIPTETVIRIIFWHRSVR